MAEAVAERIRSLGRKAMTIRADVSKAADVDRMVQKTLDSFSTIDITGENLSVDGGSLASMYHLIHQL